MRSTLPRAPSVPSPASRRPAGPGRRRGAEWWWVVKPGPGFAPETFDELDDANRRADQLRRHNHRPVVRRETHLPDEVTG